MSSHVSATSSVLGTNSIGKEDFLKLLVTQLQYQDPLDPLDAQDFASQLAEFTAMEQQLITNELLEAQIELNSAVMLESQNGAAIGMIGSGIVMDGNQVTLGGTPNQTGFIATTGAAAVTVNVANAAGEVVLTIDTGVPAAGMHRIDLGQATEDLPPGQYTLSVDVTAAAEGVLARPLASGTVEGVRWGDFGPLLVVGQQEIPLSNVLEITR